MMSTRRATFTAFVDDPAELQKVFTAIDSEEKSVRLWAIDRLPLRTVRGGDEVTARCYKLLSTKLTKEDVDICEAIMQSIDREIKAQFLTPDVRTTVLLPIVVRSVYSELPGDWGNLLYRLGKSLKSSYSQALAHDILAQVVNDASYYGYICSMQLIKGLCEANALIPPHIIEKVVQRPDLLKGSLPGILVSTFNKRGQAAVQLFNDCVRILGPNARIFEALLMIPNPPPEGISFIKEEIDRYGCNQEVASVIARKCDRIIQMKLSTANVLYDIVCSSNIFTVQYTDDVVMFFKKLLPVMKEETAMRLLNKIGYLGGDKLLQLIPLYMKRFPDSRSIVRLLMSQNITVYLDAWLKAFDMVVQTTKSDQLVRYLVNHLEDEIENGHPSKWRQRPVAEGPYILRPKTLKVCGWREIAQMFIALSKIPDLEDYKDPIIECMEKALTVHTNPLIFSISQLLKRLLVYPEGMGFLRHLLVTGKRLVFLRLIPFIKEQIPVREFGERFATNILNAASSKDSTEKKAALAALVCLGPSFVAVERHELAVQKLEDAKTSKDPIIADFVQENFAKIQQFIIMDFDEIRPENQSLNGGNHGKRDPLSRASSHKKVGAPRSHIIKPSISAVSVRPKHRRSAPVII